MKSLKFLLWGVLLFSLSGHSFAECDLLELDRKYLSDSNFKSSSKVVAIRYFDVYLLFPNRFVFSSNPVVKGRFSLGGNHEAQDRYFDCDIKTYLSEVISFGLVEECSECKLGKSSEQWKYERLSLPTNEGPIYSQRYIFNGRAVIGHIYNSTFYIKFESPSRAIQDFVENQLEDYHEATFE